MSRRTPPLDAVDFRSSQDKHDVEIDDDNPSASESKLTLYQYRLLANYGGSLDERILAGGGDVASAVYPEHM